MDSLHQNARYKEEKKEAKRLAKIEKLKNKPKKVYKLKKKMPEYVDYKTIGEESRPKKPVLCEYCKLREGCHWHHIWSSFRGKRDNSPTNLIWLCYGCHNEIHTVTGSTFAFREKLSRIVLTLIR